MASINTDQNTDHDSPFDETAKRLHHKLFPDMEIPSQGSDKQCNICVGDLINLFIGSCPKGNRQSQIDQIAQDLRSEYDKPAPTSEDNAQYADTKMRRAAKPRKSTRTRISRSPPVRHHSGLRAHFQMRHLANQTTSNVIDLLVSPHYGRRLSTQHVCDSSHR